MSLGAIIQLDELRSIEIHELEVAKNSRKGNSIIVKIPREL